MHDERGEQTPRLGRASRILAYRGRLAGLAALGIGLVVVEIGLFGHAPIVPPAQRLVDALLVALLLAMLHRLNQHMAARGAPPVMHVPEEALLWVLLGGAALAPIFHTVGMDTPSRVLSVASLSLFTKAAVAYEGLKVASALPRAVLAGRVARLGVSPAAAVALSFALLIAAGTILLSIPAATASGRLTKPVDALFTATSASCVTGLIVHDTPTHWSLFGQLVILALLQIGGLGTMTMAAVMRLLLRRRTPVLTRFALRDTFAPLGTGDLAHLALRIVQFTAICEGLGAALLTLRWWAEGMSWAQAAYRGLFHSISAFCNAGFSVFSNSLEDYAADPVVNIVVGGLIIVGGLGFPAVADIYHFFRDLRAGRRAHLALHTRLVLITTAVLLAGAFVFFVLVEWNGAFAGRPPAERMWAALFASITPRTAGFDTVVPAKFSVASQFVTIALMTVGASPGSTGGGVKTTTAALIVVLILAMARGERTLHMARRSIGEETRHRAFAIFGLMLAALFAVTLILCLTEPGVDLNAAMFEAASALGTVGLSLGLTKYLTTAGRLVITAAMYVGRIGPLTLALAILAPRRHVVEYPREEVMVG